jgi:hypothetical protein
MVLTAVLAFGATRNASAQEPAPPLQWPDAPPPPPAPPPRVDASPPRIDRDRVREALDEDPDISASYRHGRGLVIGGAVSVGASGASLLLAGVFSVTASSSGPTYEDDPDYAGDESAQRAAIGFAVTGLVLLAVGVPMLAVGVRERREAVHEARRKVDLARGPRGFGLRF